MAVPLFTKVCFALALGLSIALAFFGPPPQRGSRATMNILVVIAVAWYGLATIAFVDDHGTTWVSALLAAGILTTCLAAWMARYRPEPPEDDGAKPPEPPGPPGDEPYVPLWAGRRDASSSGSRLWHDG